MILIDILLDSGSLLKGNALFSQKINTVVISEAAICCTIYDSFLTTMCVAMQSAALFLRVAKKVSFMICLGQQMSHKYYLNYAREQ